jgi:cell division protein FtsW (lipid II flippase)
MQVLLIGSLTAENNAAKSIIYDIYLVSQGEAERADSSEPITQYIDKEQAVQIVAELDIDFEEINETTGERKIQAASDIEKTEASVASSYLKTSDLFPDYEKELTQRAKSRENAQATSLAKDLLIGVVIAAIVAFFVLKLYWHYYDVVILLIMAINFLLLAVMLLFAGGVQGDVSKINLFGVQPLELVKLCYVFVFAGLLCKPERAEVKIFNRTRGQIALAYMFINLVFFALLKELGTLLILTLLGLSMLFIFGQFKDFLIAVVAHLVIGGIGGVLAVFRLTPIGETLYARFIYFFQPNKAALSDGTSGFQYIQLKKSLAVSEWFAPTASRYKFYMPAEETDLVFAKMVQVAGIVLAMLVVVCYILLLVEGFKIAYRVTDQYYRGLAMGISILLAFQGIIHIAYNVNLIPITGVPLSYISKGGSNQAVSLIATALLIIISANGLKRVLADEVRFEEETVYGKKIQKFFR